MLVGVSMRLEVQSLMMQRYAAILHHVLQHPAVSVKDRGIRCAVSQDMLRPNASDIAFAFAEAAVGRWSEVSAIGIG